MVLRGESALVVAPASAGKTYASFYALLRLLHKLINADSKKSAGGRKGPATKKVAAMQARFVFVAHDKPLADQMSSYLYDMLEDTSLFGVFTANYRVNVETCLILICTPAIFSILLHSPDCRGWADSLAYVIFDEIDCISTASEKSSLESFEEGMRGDYARAVALTQCPFLALSATVRDPESLREWLQQLHPTHVVHLIPSEEADARTMIRWNDVEYYQYLPAVGFSSSKNNEGKQSEQKQAHILAPFHPFSLLADREDSSVVEFDFDVTLSPEYTFQLYRAMDYVLAQHENDDDVFRDEMAEHSKRDSLGELREKLTPINNLGQGRVTKWQAHEYQLALKEELRNWPMGWQQIVGEQLSTLHPSTQPDVPPTKLSIKELGELAFELFFDLKEKGMFPALCFCQGDRDNTSTLAEFIVERLEAEEAKQLSKEKSKRHHKRSAVEADDPSQEEETPREKEGRKVKPIPQMLLKKIQNVMEMMRSADPSFVFTTGEKRPHQVEQIEYWLKRLIKRTGWKHSSFPLRALARGIGIYHAGMPKPYRDIVDVCFREGALPVVLATRILSRGVNMPCKTVVLLNDDVKHLSGVDVRQMTGRAGRRGFDNEGYVVALDISRERLSKLLLSPLPKLKTSPLIDVSTVLKMYIMRSQLGEAIVPTLRRLLTPPLGQPRVRARLRDELTLQFSVRLFQAMKLIHPDTDQPTGLAGLVSRMSETFPANFALAYIIMTGVLESNPEFLKEEVLLSMLCCLIPNLHVPSHNPTHSLALPKKIQRGLKGYSLFVLEAVGGLQPKKNKKGSTQSSIPLPEDKKLWARVVSSACLPVPDPQLINSYAVDFLAHGSIAQICAQNGMSDAKAYYLIDSCDGLLRKIARAVAECIGSGPLVAAFVGLARHFNHNFTVARGK